MFIQKTLHVHRTLDETKTRFLALPLYRRAWEGLARVEFHGKEMKMEFQAGLGVVVQALIENLRSENPDELLFHSCEGNVAVMGMIEFTPIKPRLTEVTLTLDYTVESPLRAFMNRVTGAIDRFLDDQIGIIEPILKGEVKTESPVYREASPALSICLR